MPDSIAAPLELPRLVMRNALMAAAATIALAMLLGIWRMSGDIGGEVDSAAALAGLMARLGGSQSDPDREVLATLAETQQQHPLRHLELHVTGPDGRLLWARRHRRSCAGRWTC